MQVRVRALVYAVGTWAWRRILVWWVLRETRRARVRRERAEAEGEAEAEAEAEARRAEGDQWVRIEDWAEARRQWDRDARRAEAEAEVVRARTRGGLKR